MTEFHTRVLEVVRAIPKGTVMTYKQVAIAAGNPGAARAVGTIMKNSYKYDFGNTIPCHRVVRSDGHVGDYAGGGPESKQDKLRAEGVELPQ